MIADLITGFLGSGKTTFIKKYADYLIGKGENICILENDYGAVNVDAMLLQNLQNSGRCDIETVAGAFDSDCHKRRFKSKLITIKMLGYDRVIIEPSGIFDVDEFFDVLREEPLDKFYEIGNIISIVDPNLEEKLSDESEYLLASQCAVSGKIVFSKASTASYENIQKTLFHINNALRKANCKRIFSDDEIIIKDWENFNDKDFEDVLSCGYKNESCIKNFSDNNNYTSLYFMNLKLDKDKLKDISEKILNDNSCGNVFRVKGFINNENQWYELNAMHGNININPINNGQEIIIVIGENLDKKAVNSYFE